MMESLHGNTDSGASGKPTPLPAVPTVPLPVLPPQRGLPGRDVASLFSCATDSHLEPCWLCSHCSGHCNDPSPFVINPRPYPWHSIPRATAARSSASAPSHPSGPCQPPWGARVGRGVLPGPSTFLKRSRGCRQQRRCCVPEPQPEQELGAKGSLLACWSKWQVIKRNCDRRENVPESTRTSPG